MTEGETGTFLMCRAMLSKSLIQFFVDGWDCVPSLLFDLRPNYGGGNEDNGDLLQKAPCRHCCSVPPSLQQAPANTLLTQSSADPYLLRRHSNTVLSRSVWGLPNHNPNLKP